MRQADALIAKETARIQALYDRHLLSRREVDSMIDTMTGKIPDFQPAGLPEPIQDEIWEGMHRGEERSGCITKILLAHGADANAKIDRVCSPLVCALLYDADTAIIEDLLKHGADPNVKDIVGTPLWIMLGHDQPDIIALLKQYGAKK
jgi:hypothetical protein